VTCHQPGDAWTVTPASLSMRFAMSGGTDPIFSTNDGSNCEGAAPFTMEQRRSAFSLLLTRGLIRVGVDVPEGAEFTIDSVDDPYQCHAALTGASMYRRPLPATNLAFLSAVMWDGRESWASTTILQDLAHQANDATLGHPQATVDLTPEQAQQGPILRGLAARAPYFHNGSALTLDDGVDFHTTRFGLDLTARERERARGSGRILAGALTGLLTFLLVQAVAGLAPDREGHRTGHSSDAEWFRVPAGRSSGRAEIQHPARIARTRRGP
jgi:hypothetical protein